MSSMSRISAQRPGVVAVAPANSAPGAMPANSPAEVRKRRMLREIRYAGAEGVSTMITGKLLAGFALGLALATMPMTLKQGQSQPVAATSATSGQPSPATSPATERPPAATTPAAVEEQLAVVTP